MVLAKAATEYWVLAMEATEPVVELFITVALAVATIALPAAAVVVVVVVVVGVVVEVAPLGAAEVTLLVVNALIAVTVAEKNNRTE